MSQAGSTTGQAKSGNSLKTESLFLKDGWLGR